MVNTTQDFTQVFLTYKDVREANPNWTERMIEDYIGLKRDLLTTADTNDLNDTDMRSIAAGIEALVSQLSVKLNEKCAEINSIKNQQFASDRHLINDLERRQKNTEQLLSALW